MTLSFDEFVAVMLDTNPARQVWLDIPAGLATSTMATREAAQKFYDNWTLIGQPGLKHEPIPQQHLAFVQPGGAPAYVPPPAYSPAPALALALAPAATPAGTAAADPYRTPAPYGSAVDDAVVIDTSDARAAAKRSAIYGFLIAGGGVAITAGTYAFAAPGQTFVVAWGAIVFGLFRGIRGLVISNRA